MSQPDKAALAAAANAPFTMPDVEQIAAELAVCVAIGACHGEVVLAMREALRCQCGDPAAVSLAERVLARRAVQAVIAKAKSS